MNQHTSRSRIARIAAAALAVSAAFAACGSDAKSSEPTNAPASAIDVTAAWARTSPKVAGAGAVYMTIANSGGVDDALVGVSVDPSIAMSAEMHETVAVDASMSTAGDMTTATTAEPMMEMRPVARIVVPAAGSVALAPGGYHIMLMELAEPLVVGNSVSLTLKFASSAEKVVKADVRDTAP